MKKLELFGAAFTALLAAFFTYRFVKLDLMPLAGLAALVWWIAAGTQTWRWYKKYMRTEE